MSVEIAGVSSAMLRRNVVRPWCVVRVRGTSRHERGAPRVVCNVVQRIPKNAAADGIERPLHKKADPVLPRSAVIDFDSDEFHTHEVTGSSPVAPTTKPNYCNGLRAALDRALFGRSGACATDSSFGLDSFYRRVHPLDVG
jgi:hypothetical protein